MVTGEYRAACRPHVHVIHVQSEARRVLEAAFLCLSCWGREGYLKLQGRWNRCNIDLAVEAAKSLQSGTYQCVPLFFQAFFLLVVGRCIETQDTVQTQKCQANVMWTRLFHHICPFYQSYFFIEISYITKSLLYPWQSASHIWKMKMHAVVAHDIDTNTALPLN